MAKLFNNVGGLRPKRTAFDLSHERKFTMNMGNLTPILCEEVVPGDSWKLNTEVFMRFMPLLAPIMHRVNVYTHFFFVPNRLIWNEWQEFITGGEDGLASPVFPAINLKNVGITAVQVGKSSLYDYLGFPTLTGAVTDVGLGDQLISALPFRAYQLIYNEYYRDQNLQEKINFSISSGQTGELSELLTLRKRCWEKDYFTSSLPFAQKGAEVNVPLYGSAPVILSDQTENGALYMKNSEGAFASNPSVIAIKGGTGSENKANIVDNQGTPVELKIDPNGTLETDLSGVTSGTINDLRQAFQLQKWLERNARAGSRYIESILAHFGVKSSDARLQRPEYLGGGMSPVIISEVLQTSATETETPQGNMAGHAISVGNSHSFNRFFEEHGYIIGIMSVMPRTAYQQGIPRKFTKFDKYDYYWPEFAHLGEQEVRNKELYYTGAATNVPEGTFGYQGRYAEYKYLPSTVHGDLRDSLQFWHMGRTFTSKPSLNASFVESNPTEDIFAVEGDEDKLIVQTFNNITAFRPMPYDSEPGLIDHF